MSLKDPDTDSASISNVRCGVILLTASFDQHVVLLVRHQSPTLRSPSIHLAILETPADCIYDRAHSKFFFCCLGRGVAHTTDFTVPICMLCGGNCIVLGWSSDLTLGFRRKVSGMEILGEIFGELLVSMFGSIKIWRFPR